MASVSLSEQSLLPTTAVLNVFDQVYQWLLKVRQIRQDTYCRPLLILGQGEKP